MGSMSLRLRPGVDTVRTPALNEAGISSSNMIRFREGLVEKRGGWSTYGGPVSGIPRAIAAWKDFHGTQFVAVATTSGVIVLSNGVATDISTRTGVSTAASFYTTAGSNTVLVTDASYAPTVNDSIVFLNPVSANGAKLLGSMSPTPINATQYTVQAATAATSTGSTAGVLVQFSTTTNSNVVTCKLANHGYQVGFLFITNDVVTVGGVTIAGLFTIQSVPDSSTFTLSVTTPASSAASVYDNGGVVSLLYAFVPLIGAIKQGSPNGATDWTLANYGQLLVAASAGIYIWQPDGSYATLKIIPNAPTGIKGIVVSDAQQMIIAYGNSSQYGDANYVYWCDAGNYNTWTASGANQAGSYRIPTGSGIVGAASFGQQVLLWTDVDLWAMQYIGYPFVWGFNKISTGCGSIAQGASVRLGSQVFWMGQGGFWVYDGASVRSLDCPVWDSVFPLIGSANTYKIKGGANSAFHEVMWFFPSTSGSGENDTYVCFNVAENAWDVGSLSRAAWIDKSIAGQPVAADPLGNVVQHETSPDGAGVAIQASFTTGWFLLDEGETFSFVDLIRPDIKFPTGVGSVQVSVLTCAYTTDAPTVAGPFSITAATEFINTRCRGRYVALRFASADLGSFWRIGRPQMRFAPSGRR